MLPVGPKNRPYLAELFFKNEQAFIEMFYITFYLLNLVTTLHSYEVIKHFLNS